MTDQRQLVAHGVRVEFGGICALDDVQIGFPAGRISALIGPNGAGKSTLVNVLTGFQQPRHGHVRLEGDDVTGKAPQRLARRGIMRTFQSPRILPSLSVLENLLLAERSRPSSRAFAAVAKRRSTRIDEEAAVARAYEALRAFSLLDIAHNRGGEISGGQQRLVELARMTRVKPRYLFLDEPTAGVAPAMRHTMVEHLQRLHRLTGAALIVVEHDMAVVDAVADEVFVMVEGRLLTQGDMAAVRADARVLDAYLGATVSPARVGTGTLEVH